MSDERSKTEDKLCNFTPEEKDAAKEDAILFRKPRTLEELNESSDRCLKHVTEHLDQLEAEINAGANKTKSD